MKINKFTEHIHKKAFKTKEELDTMSKDEIVDHKISISGKSLYDRKTGRWDTSQYLDELNVYEDVRFKQDIYDNYEKWIRMAENGEGKDDTDKRTYKLLAQILNREGGKDFMYNNSLKKDIEKVGEFYYILGIDFEK
jgi:hypothetical protein